MPKSKTFELFFSFCRRTIRWSPDVQWVLHNRPISCSYTSLSFDKTFKARPISVLTYGPLGLRIDLGSTCPVFKITDLAASITKRMSMMRWGSLHSEFKFRRSPSRIFILSEWPKLLPDSYWDRSNRLPASAKISWIVIRVGTAAWVVPGSLAFTLHNLFCYLNYNNSNIYF